MNLKKILIGTAVVASLIAGAGYLRYTKGYSRGFDRGQTEFASKTHEEISTSKKYSPRFEEMIKEHPFCIPEIKNARPYLSVDLMGGKMDVYLEDDMIRAIEAYGGREETERLLMKYGLQFFGDLNAPQFKEIFSQMNIELSKKKIRILKEEQKTLPAPKDKSQKSKA